MRTLIQNYSSTLSTEPMYLHRCLVESGEEAHLWSDQNQSAYDIFDYIKPDLFVSHYKFLTNDILKYLSQSKNIAMALNVTGASQDDIEKVESVLQQAKVNIALTFTNLYENTLRSKLDIKQLYPAADIFLSALPTPDYEMDTCFFALSDSEDLNTLQSKESNYHTVGFTQSDKPYADMSLDVTSSVSFYNKYRKCVLVGDVNFVTSQILYDCLLKCKSINLKVHESQQKVLDSRLANLFSEISGEDMSEILKNQIKTKHNCIRRSAKFFRLLKAKDVSEKLERMSEKL